MGNKKFVFANKRFVFARELVARTTREEKKTIYIRTIGYVTTLHMEFSKKHNPFPNKGRENGPTRPCQKKNSNNCRGCEKLNPLSL